MRRLALGLLLALPAFAAEAGPGEAGAWLSFSIDRNGSPPLRYDIRVDGATGHGFYRPAPSSTGTAGASAPVAEMPISVDAPIVKRLFAAVPLVQGHRCETHEKHLAQTGAKTLRYAQSDVVAECSYNYSDDERVNTATALFLALGETMQYGDRLAAKLRFDRLGLDGEMDDLQSALRDGRALDVGNIAAVLAQIQNDDRVMERVRRKAAHLLASAGLPSAQSLTDSASNRSNER